jgi:hypothetical protein
MTESERAVVERLLNAEFPGAANLRAQAERAVVKRIDDGHGPILEFDVPDDVAVAVTERRVPVEAQANDVDGVVIHILVHVLNGRLREVEAFREDGLSIRRYPSAHELDILVL